MIIVFTIIAMAIIRFLQETAMNSNYFCTFAVVMAKQRIEYIDAMRGFTMILVVYSHICHFCLGDSLLGFNATFFLFRLPCFFLISGWLFEPVSRRPFWQITRRKFMVQIVPTFIFLLLLAPPPEFFHQLGALKGGYWFTFVLFEFFLIYMLSVRCCWRCAWLLALAVSVGSFCFASQQNHLRLISPDYRFLSPLLDVAGFLSIGVWRYYLFFYIGTLVRRHFDAFVSFTSKPLVIVLLTAGFFAVASTPHPSSDVLEYLRFNGGGILGMLMVFIFFRLSAPWLQRLHLSRPLQYVGTRTLDIYLLHYFFLPRYLMAYSPQLHAYDNSLIEFVVIMLISLVVLLITLLTSYILRLSPFLAHYLFGVDRPVRDK